MGHWWSMGLTCLPIEVVVLLSCKDDEAKGKKTQITRFLTKKKIYESYLLSYSKSLLFLYRKNMFELNTSFQNTTELISCYLTETCRGSAFQKIYEHYIYLNYDIYNWHIALFYKQKNVQRGYKYFAREVWSTMSIRNVTSLLKIILII